MLAEKIPTSKITTILGVSESFVLKWKNIFALDGVDALRLQYSGSEGYLSQEQKEEIYKFLQSKVSWTLDELKDHILTTYDVIYQSDESYYSIFENAKISWKKTQKINPKKDPEKVEARRIEIKDLLEKNKDDIMAEKLTVWFVDECHLLSGDILGYVWGKQSERLEVPITNERERVTYYGALNYLTGKFVVQQYDAGNSANTVEFIKYLRSLSPESKDLIIWDGASYHKHKEMATYLKDVNQGLEKKDWPVTCELFAPNDPDQNPVEDIWLQAKNFLRKFWMLCSNFKIVQWLFKFMTHGEIFKFEKLKMYGDLPWEYSTDS
jgi:transposase